MSTRFFHLQTKNKQLANLVATYGFLLTGFKISCVTAAQTYGMPHNGELTSIKDSNYFLIFDNAPLEICDVLAAEMEQD